MEDIKANEDRYKSILNGYFKSDQSEFLPDDSIDIYTDWKDNYEEVSVLSSFQVN